MIIRTRTVFIFLSLIGLLVYLNSFDVPFHYDDIRYLKENLQIKSFDVFWGMLSEDYSRVFTGRPFLLFTFLLNYKLGGLDTFGYHFLNLLIHISTAFLFYLLLSRYVDRVVIASRRRGNLVFKKDCFVATTPRNDNSGVAILAATLFLLHPINTESVTYISSRSSELSAFFILASMLCFFRATSPPHPPLGKEGQEGGKSKFNLGFYIFSLLFFILGLSTKEAAIVLPALLILFDYFFISMNSKNLLLRIKYYLPYLIIVGLLSILYMGYITSPMPAERPWLTHILTEVKVFTEYLRLLLVPVGLTIDHDINPSSFFDTHVIFSLLIILTLIFASVFLRKKTPVISFSILWFFINMIPFLVVKLNDFMAERWVYIASAGFSLGLSGVLILIKDIRRRAGIALIGVIFLLFGSLTVMRNHVYLNEISLWEDAAKKSPDSYGTYVNLSRAYRRNGNITKTIENAHEAIRKGKNRNLVVIMAYINLSAAYEDMGDYKKAEEVLRSIEKYTSNHYTYYHNLGVVYMKMGECEKALIPFKKAIQIRPNSPTVLFLLGHCYESIFQKEKAKEYFMLSTKSIPQDGQEYISQGIAFSKLGDNKKAIECFFEAIKTDPFELDVRMYLSNALFKLGHYDIAFKHYSIASEISPHHAPAYAGMGKAMLAKGNLKEARKHFNKALSLLSPDSPDRKELLELLNKTKG